VWGGGGLSLISVNLDDTGANPSLDSAGMAALT